MCTISYRITEDVTRTLLILKCDIRSPLYVKIYMCACNCEIYESGIYMKYVDISSISHMPYDIWRASIAIIVIVRENYLLEMGCY